MNRPRRDRLRNLTFAKIFPRVLTHRMQSALPSITAISKAFGISRQTFYDKSRSLGLSKADWLSPEVVFSKMLATGNTSPLRTRLSNPATRETIKTNISK